MPKTYKAIVSLFLLLFLILPFEKRIHAPFDAFSRSLAPSNLIIPEYFSTKVFIFPSDLIIFVFVLLMIYTKRSSWHSFFWEGPSKFLTLFFSVALFSILFSTTANYPLQYIRLLQLSVFLFLFNALFSFFSSFSLVKKWCWLMCLVSLLESGIGIVQYFCQRPLGLKFFGEPNIFQFKFKNPEGHRWLLDRLFGVAEWKPVLYRSSGTFSHPNILGGFLFCTLLCTIYLLFFEEKKSKRSFLSLALAAQIFALCLTFSRSAFIALALAIIIWSIIQFRMILAVEEKQKRGDHVRRFAHLWATLVITGTLCFTLFYSQLFARGGVINYNAVVQKSDSERLFYQQASLDMVRDHPLFGIGFNNFQLHSAEYTPNNSPFTLWSKVHNIYLLIAAETGLVGLFCFLLFLFSIFKRVYQSLWTPEKLLFFSIFVGFLFIGGCDFYFLHTSHGRILFFSIAAFLYSVSLQNSPLYVSSKNRKIDRNFLLR